MKHKFYNKISFLILSFCFFVLIYFMYLMLYTPKYFETSQPFKLEKKEYHIGETLTYTSEYCKYRDYIPLSVKRYLTDGFVYPLPDISETSASLSVFPTGCRNIEVDIPLLVPMRVPTNKPYYVEIVIEYRINALRTEVRKFKTECFTLLPAIPLK